MTGASTTLVITYPLGDGGKASLIQTPEKESKKACAWYAVDFIIRLALGEPRTANGGTSGCFGPGVDKWYRPLGHSRPTTCFCKHKFLGTHPCPFICIQSMAVLLFRYAHYYFYLDIFIRLECRVATETIWLQSLNLFVNPEWSLRVRDHLSMAKFSLQKHALLNWKFR